MHFTASASVAATLLSLVAAAPLQARASNDPPGDIRVAQAPHSGPCHAGDDWFIMYDQFQDYDTSVPQNTYWNFHADAGLNATKERMGSLPWQPAGSLYAWHIQPDLASAPMDAQPGDVVSATASIYTCLKPGHLYNLRFDVGGIVDNQPYDPIMTVDIDGNYAIQNWKVCDYPWKCPGDYSDDFLHLYTTAGEHILPVFTDSLVNIPGPALEDPSAGQWMKATFKFDWPVDKLNDGNRGVWFTRTYLRMWQ